MKENMIEMRSEFYRNWLIMSENKISCAVMGRTCLFGTMI